MTVRDESGMTPEQRLAHKEWLFAASKFIEENKDIDEFERMRKYYGSDVHKKWLKCHELGVPIELI